MSAALHLRPAPRHLELLGGEVALAPGMRPPRAEMADAVIDPGADLPPQGYELRISEREIRITAGESSGLVYGRQTLDQILMQRGRSLPTLRIRDWPDFPVRGYMLDISRDRIPTQNALLRLVEMLAALRFNQLQLYTEHSFAYAAHETVWREASPMTPEEIRELDAHCAEHGIELIPNQNSFGHMERWLRHADYKHLAELPESEAAACLAPGPETLTFMASLYDELLPCFRSRAINIGCDETFELGKGRSREACAARGAGRIYLEHLLGLIDPLRKRGYSVQFWGDIVRQHPELADELPREDLVALVWGYEASQDPDDLPESVRQRLDGFGFSTESLRGFTWRARPFAEAGLPFYVCPGTSSWNSLIGRLPNARANLLDAARSGRMLGAEGYLITDWGDNGHLQPPVVSLPALIYGAAVSWCAERNAELPLESAVAELAGGDTTLAKALLRLGALYDELGVHAFNASPLATALLRPLSAPALTWGKTDAERLEAVVHALDEERKRLTGADLLRRELCQAAGLARHGAWRLSHSALGRGPDHERMARDLGERIKEQRALWLERSRLGGLPDSLARLERALAEYRA